MEQKKKQLKFHEKVCKNKYFRGIVTPSEKDNQNMKSDKMPSIIYVDIESLNKKEMDVQTIQKILQQQK